MYKNDLKGFTYSASDLVVYMRSPFDTWMTRFSLERPDLAAEIEQDEDEMMGLLAQKGNAHELAFLESLKEQYGADHVVCIMGGREVAAEQTLEAMKAGVQVIFQGFLQRENFAGYTDFLVRCEGSSDLGDYHYEVWDTKLSKSTRPYFLLQLCCYSWMLERIQGRLPENTVVVLGDNSKDSYRVAAYYSYFQNLKKYFLEDQKSFKTDFIHRPDPMLCDPNSSWRSYAQQLLTESDSLALVANIRKTQVKQLQKMGINSLTELEQTKLGYVKGIAPETFYKLKAQASIQLASRGKEKPLYQVLKDDSGKGLSALPPHCDLDVFFDIEGDPLIEGGLEYLWGVSFHDPQGRQGNQYAFKDWWAHNQEQEQIAFEGFFDWVYSRWKQNTSMHIYHYASYEITAVRKLSTRYQTRLSEVSEMLNANVFIDLYKLVKGGLLIGEPRYSIKNVEHLFRGKRETQVASGGESVVVYEDWREGGGANEWASQDNGLTSWQQDADNFDWSPWPVLSAIRDYNIDDCESTLDLVEWLRLQQKKNEIVYKPPEQKIATEEEKNEQQINREQKREELKLRQQGLIDLFTNSETLKKDAKAELLVSLLLFYERERKPQAWSYYDRLEKTEDELFHDDTVVYGLTITHKELENNSYKCTAIYSNDQPIRTDKISSATVQGSEAKATRIKFEEVDHHESAITFNIKQDQSEVLENNPLTLFGDEMFINTDTLEMRLCDVTEAYFETGKLSGSLTALLERSAPKFKGTGNPLPVCRKRYPVDQEYLDAIIKTVHAMDNTCLCIQGPPGAGKTYTAEHVIASLVKQGKRVGIMSNSHAAIMNLLLPVASKVPNNDTVKIGGFKTQKEFKQLFSNERYPQLFYRTGMKFTGKQPYESFAVVGATAYGFAKEEMREDPLDYLFVDEASQVAMANLVAVSGATKNIILMGDQMQLEQPVQGSHPGEAGTSALEYMLKGFSVIPEDKGVFLERTYRMHPAICKPLSDVVYEGKLSTDPSNKNQAVEVKNKQLITQSSGILIIPVEHEDNTQCSEEEVAVVQQIINELKSSFFIDKAQNKRLITTDDILVVAPYNMQVNLLKEKLVGDVKIGTIDKFQGQEAPVVIISMAVSNVEDSPRGLDFIFDIKRLNVAISRAQALAIVVGNKQLDYCRVTNLGQMKKVGFFTGLLN
jgi:predicted RecB family nuclease